MIRPLAISLLIALAGCEGSPEDRSPCVYEHGFLTDLQKKNADKRTCQEMFDEGNSRIEALQGELNSRSPTPNEPNTLTVQRPETLGDGSDDDTSEN